MLNGPGVVVLDLAHECHGEQPDDSDEIKDPYFVLTINRCSSFFPSVNEIERQSRNVDKPGHCGKFLILNQTL